MGAEKLENTVQSMTKDISDVFSKKTVDVFEIQTDMEVEILRVQEDPSAEPPNFDVVSSVLLESSVVQAQVSLCFHEQTLLNIVSNMFDEDYSELSDEILESCGELLNIIFGGAKTTLNDEMGHNTKIAIPQVRSGDVEEGLTPSPRFTLITFSSPAGEFYLRITPLQTGPKNV